MPYCNPEIHRIDERPIYYFVSFSQRINRRINRPFLHERSQIVFLCSRTTMIEPKLGLQVLRPEFHASQTFPKTKTCWWDVGPIVEHDNHQQSNNAQEDLGNVINNPSLHTIPHLCCISTIHFANYGCLVE